MLHVVRDIEVGIDGDLHILILTRVLCFCWTILALLLSIPYVLNAKSAFATCFESFKIGFWTFELAIAANSLGNRIVLTGRRPRRLSFALSTMDASLMILEFFSFANDSAARASSRCVGIENIISTTRSFEFANSAWILVHNFPAFVANFARSKLIFAFLPPASSTRSHRGVFRIWRT